MLAPLSLKWCSSSGAIAKNFRWIATVHIYLKQKNIYILFSRTSLFLFFIHFIKSGHSFTLILTLSRSSLIPLKLHSLNVTTIVKLTPVRYNLLLLFSFLFFFILSNPVSFTLSRSLSSLISSLSSSLSQRRCHRQVHSGLSSSLSQRRRPDHRQHRRHRQVQTHAADLPQTHFSSTDPLQVSCLCLLHVMLWVFDLGITSSSADPPIHFGFLIWIHFMWMSLFFIFDCCSGLLAWWFYVMRFHFALY